MNLLTDLLELKRKYEHDYKILFELFTLYVKMNTKVCELKTNLEIDEKYFCNVLKRLDDENKELKRRVEKLEAKE